MSNEELLTILKEHLARYPKMQPQDVVKLLYQNEFGPGHLVSDRTSCIERLEVEAAKVREDTAAKVRQDEAAKTWQDETVPVIEDIGNGLARVNLARLDAMNFSLEDLADMFIRSAADVAGDKERFRCRLEFLKDSYDMLKTEFSFRELNEYLTKYIAEGCPMVSHSEIYRQAYKPAYRVVKADRIRELCR